MSQEVIKRLTLSRESLEAVLNLPAGVHLAGVQQDDIGQVTFTVADTVGALTGGEDYYLSFNLKQVEGYNVFDGSNPERVPHKGRTKAEL